MTSSDGGYEKYARRLIAQSPLSMWLSDNKGTLVDINGPCCTLFNVSEAEVVGKYNLFEDNIISKQGHMPAVSAVFKEAKVASFLTEYDSSKLANIEIPHGAKATLLVTIYPIVDDDGIVTNAVVQHIDKTNLDSIALAESEKRFKQFMDHVPGAVFMKDANGRVLFMNKFLQDLLGNPKQWYGKTTEQLIAGPVGEAMAKADGDALKQGYLAIEEQLPGPDGKLNYYKTRKFAIPKKDGSSLLGGISIDITAEKKAEMDQLEFERNLLESQRLESLGLLAGGIAHDFNNLLMAVVGNLDLALMDISSNSPARFSLDEAKKAARRATELTRQMLAYAGKGRFKTSLTYLADIIKEMVGFLETSIDKKAQLHVSLGSKLPFVEVDVSQIQQVLMNLVINSSESFEGEPGLINISTGLAELKSDELNKLTTGLVKGKDMPLPPGKYVYLEVSDNGCGMDEGVQARLFEPFFTTKFLGRGLGMAAVLGIVKSHRGAILLKSDLGQGTTFRVYIPCSEESAQNVLREEATSELVKGKGGILVIDDESYILAILERMLERLGYEVFTAASGADGISLYEKQRQSIDCIILDLTMPMMNGVEVLASLRNLGYHIPVILASGYNTGAKDHPYAQQGFAAFIKKPIELDILSQTLTSVLTETTEPEKAPA